MDYTGKADAGMGQSAASLSDGELIQRLRARAADCRQNSMTARLATVIDEVEALLVRGYDRSQVRDVLVGAGCHFTPDSFDSALARIRKRKRRSANGLRASVIGKSGPSVGVESAVSGDAAARSNLSEGTGFADAFVKSEGSRSGRRWK
ncbi:hypothetical protein ACKI2N_015745 [Cupriavidus sp. 30B13]|uniref:hypothetical protein n=1 Tax=Cupriavidus sp. 30B13 TaxID=3384241 RepID=UPI003B8F1FA1